MKTTKNVFKKSVSVLLSVLMIMGCFGVCAFAGDDVPDNKLITSMNFLDEGLKDFWTFAPEGKHLYRSDNFYVTNPLDLISCNFYKERGSSFYVLTKHEEADFDSIEGVDIVKGMTPEGTFFATVIEGQLAAILFYNSNALYFASVEECGTASITFPDACEYANDLYIKVGQEMHITNQTSLVRADVEGSFYGAPSNRTVISESSSIASVSDITEGKFAGADILAVYPDSGCPCIRYTLKGEALGDTVLTFSADDYYQISAGKPMILIVG